jgi:hypothetical protein
MSVRGRHAALLVVALVVGFQLPGLGRDGLLSDASALRSTVLWRDDYATAPTAAIASDYVRYFAPWAAFVQRGLRAGTLPLWNPYVGTGVPVSEALQPALFHPTTLLLAVLPLEHALTLLALLRLALAGLGAFVLARVLGCGAASAAMAGVLYALEPFHLVLRFHTLPNVSACLPWLLALSEHELRGGAPRRTLAAWALVAALACLGGHSQTTAHVLGVAAAYHLVRAMARPAALGRALGFVGAGVLLGALGGLVAVWGHTELVLDGFARTFRAFRGTYPQLPPSHLASFLAPVGLSGVQVPAYVGLVALVLAAGGLAGRVAFPAWPWAVLTLACGAVAYGLRPISDAVAAMPFIGLADHSRLLIVVHLGLAILAARGVECLDDARARRVMLVVLAAFAAGLVALAAGGVVRAGLVGPAASLGFAAALLILPRAFPATAWLAALLVVADLYAAYGPVPRGGERLFPPAPPALASLDGRPDGERAVIAQSVLPANVATFYEVPSLAAFEPSMSEATVQLLVQAGLSPSFHLGMIAGPEVNAAALRVFDLLGVGTIVLPDAVRDDTVRGRLEEMRREPFATYRNPHAMPRVFAVSEARAAGDSGAALALIADPMLDLRRTVVLETSSTLPPYAPGDAAATPVSYAPGDVRVRATCTGPCWVVLTETFAPGWRAAVDGSATEVLRADRALVAVAVPPGTHDVALVYRPWSVVIGAPISLLVLCMLAAAALRRPRLAPRGPAR